MSPNENWIFFVSSIFSDALSSSLSAFYAKIVVIAGIAVPVTEILTSRIPSVVYQSFYVYLYSVSIAFVIFVYTAHMRTRAVFSLIKSYRKFNSEFRWIFPWISFIHQFCCDALLGCRWKNQQRLFGEEKNNAFWKFLPSGWCHFVRYRYNGILGPRIRTVFRVES